MFERHTRMEDSIPDRPEDSVPGPVEDRIPEGFERKLPPGIGDMKYEPRREFTMESLAAIPWVRRFRVLLILVPIGIAVGLAWLSWPHPVSQQQAEQDVSSLVGRAEGTTVTAKCSVPDSNGYSCTLRDAAGRYGFSITLTSIDKQHSDRLVTRTIANTQYGFPLNADGTGSQTVDATSPADLSLGETAVLASISSALGDDNFLTLYGDIDCGDQSQLTTAVTPCKVKAPILSATVKSVGNGRFLISYKVRVPGS